jgi:nucleotidyltransferase substrate binding protein (TIGR01987 family)
MLDVSPLERAISQLRRALEVSRSEVATAHPDLPALLRAATIQAFEYTYELSHKMLRRHLEASEPDPAAVAAMSFNALIRLGFARGLLNEELAVWLDFREARGATSHAYNERKAQAVFDSIPRFLAEATVLLERLRAASGSQA